MLQQSFPGNSHPAARTRRAAFTLIELLVVIAIIAILAAILFPVFAQAREKARQTSCLSNMKQVNLSVMMYTQDYDETFPIHGLFDFDNQFGGTGGPQGWMRKIAPYMKNLQVTWCPSDSGPTVAYDRIQGVPWGPMESYAANALINVKGITANDNSASRLLGVFGLTTNYGTGPFVQTLAAITRPAETISVGEKYSSDVQYTDYNWLGVNSVDIWPTAVFLVDFDAPGGGPSSYLSQGAGIPDGTRPDGKYPLGKDGSVSAHHANMSNFAFADGHVKAMRPVQTNPDPVNRPQDNMWHATR